jgi:outer membrane protein assembly factor BamB
MRNTPGVCRSLLAVVIALAVACGDDDHAGGSARDAAAAVRGDAGARDAGNAAAAAPHAEPVPPEVLAHLADWPLPNRDYENTRANLDAAIDASNVAQLHEVWRLPFEHGSAYGFITSNPLIVGGTVYVQDLASRVYAVDRDSGALRWAAGEIAPGLGPNGIAIGWGKVFATAGDVGIAAFDTGDGRELWRFQPELFSSEGVAIQPTVYDGSVFVSTIPGSLRGLYLPGARGVLFALDERDGRPRWSFDTVDSEDLWGDPANNSGGGAWYPPLIDTETGMSYWGTGNPGPWPTPNDGRSRPGPNLYTNSVVAVSAASGELAWYHQENPHDLFDRDFQNSPLRVHAGADSGERELVIGSGKTGTVVALDARTGALVWRAAVGRHENDDLDPLPEGEPVTIYPGALGGVLTPLAYAEGVVYVPVVDLATTYTGAGSPAIDYDSGKGAVTALSVIDGSVLWSTPLDAPCYGAATVVNDLVIAPDANGTVVALARVSGEEVWRYDAPNGINAPLAVAGDLLLVPAGYGSEGSLIALRL